MDKLTVVPKRNNKLVVLGFCVAMVIYHIFFFYLPGVLIAWDWNILNWELWYLWYGRVIFVFLELMYIFWAYRAGLRGGIVGLKVVPKINVE